MCRHVAYVGPPIRPADVLLDAPHALVTQVRSPRHQALGVTNEDGWGIAWRAGDQWASYRSTTPLPDDVAGHDVLRATTTTAFVAAARRAIPGLAIDTSGNAPFVADGWAFSLNGYVGGWVAGMHDTLRRAVSPDRRAALRGDTDTEVLFALALDRLDAGADPAAALADVADLASEQPSKLNLLLSDGTTVVATRGGNSLFTRPGVVASEPWDDDGAWVEVPDGTQVVVTASEGR